MDDYTIDQLESNPLDYPSDDFDEYGDYDATSCALGDYNAFEEQQCFLDHEWDLD